MLFSYPEVERVSKEIKKLTKAEARVFLEQRGNSIEIEINHLITKHENEVAALHKKLTTGWEEQDRYRKKQQEKLLQKFVNMSNTLHDNQRIEVAKLDHVLVTKNFATTIVGKNKGAMRRDQYTLK